MSTTAVDLLGQTFGTLEPISAIPGTNTVKRKWTCLCRACGSIKAYDTNMLRSGRLQSCGCKRYELIGAKKRTHGHSAGSSNSRTYRIWTNMKTRCTNPKAHNFKHYGGRGISVCDRWMSSFESFLKDMGEAPEGKSIDRIDTNKPYQPDNCRWATQLEQMNNVRTNRMIHHNGQTMSLSALARQIGTKPQNLHYWLGRGMSVSQAINRITEAA